MNSEAGGTGAPNTTLVSQITQFIQQSSGLQMDFSEENPSRANIHQQVDGKSMSMDVLDLEDVITRFDSDGKVFLQVNFISGRKILLTDQLVGFKPAETNGLDLTKLPKVVTTPDLVSIVEAIEETLTSDASQVEEIEVLRRVFFSVIEGGESIGFDLSDERIWLTRLFQQYKKVTA